MHATADSMIFPFFLNMYGFSNVLVFVRVCERIWDNEYVINSCNIQFHTKTKIGSNHSKSHSNFCAYRLIRNMFEESIKPKMDKRLRFICRNQRRKCPLFGHCQWEKTENVARF